MKITLTSAFLCLAATSALAEKKVDLPQKLNSDAVDHRHHEINAAETAQFHPLGVMRHEHQSSHHHDDDHEEEDDGKDHSHHIHDGEEDGGKDHSHHEEKGDEEKHSDESKGSEKSKDQEKDGSKGEGASKKGGDTDSKTVSDVKEKTGVETPPALANGSSQTTTTPGAVMPTTGKTSNVAPLWLVQPFGASVWELGQTYVISWGPNPDPTFTQGFEPKALIDVRLMQGPPDNLHEVSVLQAAMDSSLNSLQWTVPATLDPSKDYSIRLSHLGDLDTYSHYFEIVPMGDPRASKSNVGEPLQMPQMTGDMTSKTVASKPATPANPLPAEKTEPAKPIATKPMHSSGSLAVPGESRQGTNMMALALALFGAVYFL